MSPDLFLHKKVGSGHKLLAQNLRKLILLASRDPLDYLDQLVSLD